jgi:hypothetical protein
VLDTSDNMKLPHYDPGIDPVDGIASWPDENNQITVRYNSYYKFILISRLCIDAWRVQLKKTEATKAWLLIELLGTCYPGWLRRWLRALAWMNLFLSIPNDPFPRQIMCVALPAARVVSLCFDSA